MEHRGTILFDLKKHDGIDFFHYNSWLDNDPPSNRCKLLGRLSFVLIALRCTAQTKRGKELSECVSTLYTEYVVVLITLNIIWRRTEAPSHCLFTLYLLLLLYYTALELRDSM